MKRSHKLRHLIYMKSLRPSLATSLAALVLIGSAVLVQGQLGSDSTTLKNSGNTMPPGSLERIERNILKRNVAELKKQNEELTARLNSLEAKVNGLSVPPAGYTGAFATFANIKREDENRIALRYYARIR